MKPVFTTASHFLSEGSHGWSVTLKDSAEDSERYLMFERPSPEYDEGEGLYFEVDDQLHSCFGGVLELVVQDKQLVIALTGKAARQTQLGATFCLALEMNDEQCAKLVTDLEKVCDGLCRVRRRSGNAPSSSDTTEK